MAYQQILPLHNMNFQMNRVLTHGEEACRKEELLEIAPKLQKFDPKSWFEQWNMLARRAEDEGRLMHATYYHRMSEFFLPEGTPEKTIISFPLSSSSYKKPPLLQLDPLERGSLPQRKVETNTAKSVGSI